MTHPNRTTLLYFLVLFITFLFFTTGSTLKFEIFKSNTNSGHYGLLADAFLNKHFYLNVLPDPRLLSLPNPYDPIQNGDYRLHDASLFHGKYFLYWGPIPAIIRILFLNRLSEYFLIFVYTLGCSFISFLIIKNLIFIYFPKLSKKYLLFSFILLSYNGYVLNFLTSHGIYFESIASAQFFFLLGLYFYILYCQSLTFSRFFLSTIFFALSLACRISYLPTVFLFLILGLLKTINTSKTTLLKLFFKILALITPILLVGFALAFYNYKRFGNFLELGTTYQLAGIYTSQIKLTDIQYIPNGIKNYLLGIPIFIPRLPFISDNNPLFYVDTERIVYSIFLIIPITIFIFFIKKHHPTIDKYIYHSLTLSSLVMFLTLSTFKYTNTRYFLDFLYLFIILGLVNLFSVVNKIKPQVKALIITILSVTFIFGQIFWLRSTSDFYFPRYVLFNRFLGHQFSSKIVDPSTLDLGFIKNKTPFQLLNNTYIGTGFNHSQDHSYLLLNTSYTRFDIFNLEDRPLNIQLNFDLQAQSPSAKKINFSFENNIQNISPGISPQTFHIPLNLHKGYNLIYFTIDPQDNLSQPTILSQVTFSIIN